MRLAAALALALLVGACGGGGGGMRGDVENPAQPAAEDCSVAAQFAAIDEHLTRDYFWWRDLRPGNPQATTPVAWFESRLYRPTDRYSYAETASAFQDFFVTGRRTGYGYTLAWDDAARTVLRVRSVEPAGPAAQAGLGRGDTIVSVDGLPPQEVAAGALPTVDTAGVKRVFVVQDAKGVQRTLRMVSAEFPLAVVTKVATVPIQRPDGSTAQVGYLAFDAFVTYGREPIGAALRSFAAAGVADVVLDMRYNGGGSVQESRDIASMLGGPGLEGLDYTTLRFNSRNQDRNQEIAFTADAVALPAPPLPALRRLIVIAGGGTASASELVINGLKPYMPVILVGTRTYGKPYGFMPQTRCGTTYNAVQFEAVNARGEGQYTSGFAPTCQVADDLSHQLGDPSEARLKAALYFAAHERCPLVPPVALGAPRAAPEEAFGDLRPPRMFLQ